MDNYNNNCVISPEDTNTLREVSSLSVCKTICITRQSCIYLCDVSFRRVFDEVKKVLYKSVRDNFCVWSISHTFNYIWSIKRVFTKL